MAEDSIVWVVRSPRVLLGAIVGAGLAVSGVAITVGTALSVGIGALRLAQGQLTETELLVILLLSRECFRPLGDHDRLPPY